MTTISVASSSLVVVVRNELYLKTAFFKATHLKKILLWQNLRDEIENIYAHIHIHIHTHV